MQVEERVNFKLTHMTLTAIKRTRDSTDHDGEGDDYYGDQSTTTTETPVLEHSQQDVSSQDCRDPNQDSLHAHEDELESPPTKNLHKSVKNKQAKQPVTAKEKFQLS